MAKVNRVADLPDWFDLDNYNGTKDFGAAEWVEQLSRRRDLLKYHPDFSSRESCKKGSKSYELRLLVWQSSLRGKTEEVEHIRQFPLFSHGKESLEKYALAPSSQPVKPVSLLDLRLQKDRDSEAVLDKYAPQAVLDRWEVLNLDTVPILGAEKIATALFPFAIESHARKGEVAPIISVDLNATDAVLAKAFEIWLKEVRAQQPEIRKRNRPAYKDWARYGLLPYLDLLIWSKETERNIPRRIFSAAVSRYDKGESALSKTVVPLAASLMRDLSELVALANYEGREQKK